MCYVVVDLEMCHVPKAARTKEFPWANETIQIGAVLLDEAYRIVDDFSTFVEPVHGCLDIMIERLTGITEADLLGAPKMPEAMKLFLDWLPKDAELVEWSNTEEMQFGREIRAMDTRPDGAEMLLGNWTDCQEMFGKKVDAKRAYSLTEALNISDIDYRDGAHNAWVDAYNTALLFTKLRQNPDYELSAYYRQLGRKEPSLKSSIGSMFSWLGTLELA